MLTIMYKLLKTRNSCPIAIWYYNYANDHACLLQMDIFLNPHGKGYKHVTNAKSVPTIAAAL